MKGKVLVVDDDPAMVNVMERLFEAYGFPYVTATGGFEAHKKLLSDKEIVFVLSDMRMPLGDGFDLLDLMKKDGIKVPVVLVTGYADATEADAISKGAVAVIAKPFDIAKLMDLVEGFLT